MNLARKASLLLLALGLASATSKSPPGVSATQEAQKAAQKAAQTAGQAAGEEGFEALLEQEGVKLDREAGVLSIPANVLIKNDLLEYLLVNPNGATHESLFLTPVRPSLLNTALLLLGVEPGHNAYTLESGVVDERGHTTRQVFPPSGDGFYLYAGWREAGETYFFRVEDLVRNLETGRSLRRHRWVYLGSRFQALKAGGAEAFLAEVEGNLINLSFFFQGNTLLTAAAPECDAQTIWAANEWLLPDSGEAVRLFFARAPLAALKPAWEAELPVTSTPSGDSAAGEEDPAR